MDLFGNIYIHLEKKIGIIWNHLELFTTIWNHVQPFTNIFNYFHPLRTISNPLNIKELLGTLWSRYDHFQAFGTIWNNVQPLGPHVTISNHLEANYITRPTLVSWDIQSCLVTGHVWLHAVFTHPQNKYSPPQKNTP